MTHWQRLTRLQKTLIIIGAVFVGTILIGASEGAWSKAWNDPASGSGANRVAAAAGYSFGSGFATFVIPFTVLILIPAAIIYGIVRLIKRRRRTS